VDPYSDNSPSTITVINAGPVMIRNIWKDRLPPSSNLYLILKKEKLSKETRIFTLQNGPVFDQIFEDFSSEPVWQWTPWIPVPGSNNVPSFKDCKYMDYDNTPKYGISQCIGRVIKTPIDNRSHRDKSFHDVKRNIDTEKKCSTMHILFSKSGPSIYG